MELHLWLEKFSPLEIDLGTPRSADEHLTHRINRILYSVKAGVNIFAIVQILL